MFPTLLLFEYGRTICFKGSPEESMFDAFSKVSICVQEEYSSQSVGHPIGGLRR